MAWVRLIFVIFLLATFFVRSEFASESETNSTENSSFELNFFSESGLSDEGRRNESHLGNEDARVNGTVFQFSDEVEQIIREEMKDMKDAAKETLLKIFGISIPQFAEEAPFGSPPEFMIDLYNTITDSYGVTLARNPYNAHIVRSFMEKNNSFNDYFYFNVSSSSLSLNESVLEAELHVFRMPTSHEQLHSSLYLTPFYILSLYEVLDMKYLGIPDLNKLLGVNYVPALGSGWEVFTVKQSVTQWIKGERGNLGFLLVATSLGGDRVPVRFARRGETTHSKQPNLVLFTEDWSTESVLPLNERKMKFQKQKRLEGSPGSGDAMRNDTAESMEDENENAIPTSSLENPRFHHALLYKDSIRHPNSVSRFRSRRSKNQTESHDGNQNSTSCGRRDLMINFEAIGWSSWIISPKGYNAFYCDGPCRFPLGQQVKPTNHATVQSIAHELKLSEGLHPPCCVPNKLLPISLLYYDDHDNVVLRQYLDMVADSCGCQ